MNKRDELISVVVNLIAMVTKKQKIRNSGWLTLYLIFMTVVYWFNGTGWFSGLMAIAALFSLYDFLRMQGINRKTKFKIIWDKNPPKFLRRFFD